MPISDDVVSALAYLRSTTTRTDLVDQVAAEIRIQNGLNEVQEYAIQELTEKNAKLNQKLTNIYAEQDRPPFWYRIKQALRIHPK